MGDVPPLDLQSLFCSVFYFKLVFKTWRFAHTHETCKYNGDSLLSSEGEAENMQSWRCNQSYLPEIRES